jgi:hypothetical protein
MPLIVPVFPGEPLYNERVRLEERDYIFRFDWAGRESRYYMTIQDEEQNLIAGVKIVANWDLLSRSRWNPDLPPGVLIAMDLEQGGEPPGLEDFGTRVRLFYYTADEDIAELAGVA